MPPYVFGRDELPGNNQAARAANRTLVLSANSAPTHTRYQYFTQCGGACLLLGKAIPAAAWLPGTPVPTCRSPPCVLKALTLPSSHATARIMPLRSKEALLAGCLPEGKGPSDL